jgi:hypothetical protein
MVGSRVPAAGLEESAVGLETGAKGSDVAAASEAGKEHAQRSMARAFPAEKLFSR